MPGSQWALNEVENGASITGTPNQKIDPVGGVVGLSEISPAIHYELGLVSGKVMSK